MSREDLQVFQGLDIDFGSIGLLEPGVPQAPYFCDPVDGEPVGRLGSDGVHFIFLPEDERVFCVDPAMGEPGTYVLPVADNFRQFLTFVLFCAGANPISQIWWMKEAQFRALLAEEQDVSTPEKAAALDVIGQAFGLEPADPFHPVKEMQRTFDGACLHFPDEYYDTLGLERPQ